MNETETNEFGETYYNIYFYVAEEGEIYYDIYLYRKYINGSNNYEAGDIVLWGGQQNLNK